MAGSGEDLMQDGSWRDGHTHQQGGGGKRKPSVTITGRSMHSDLFWVNRTVAEPPHFV